MKTSNYHLTTATPAVPRRRFATLGLVPFFAFVALLLLFWQISPIASLAQTPLTPNAVRYAAPTGSGTTCSQITPCTLQTAVSGATDGDQILALEGTYTNLPGAPTLNITRSVTISGGFIAPDWSGPDPVFHPSNLDGGGSHRVVRHFGNAIATLNGFHVRNGGNVSTGAGVLVENGELTIDNSWLHDNAATTSGGALFISNGASATIQNSEIYNNSAAGGGAIHVSFGGAHADILFNDIHDNSSTTGAASGGAVYVTGSAFLEGNEIHHNTANNGGGVYIAGGGAATAQNNMLYANTATSLGGAFYSFSTLNSWHNTVVGNIANGNGGGGFHINSAANTVQISNTIVASNTASAGFSGINHIGGTVTGDYVNLFNNTSNVAFPTTINQNPTFINYNSFLNLHLAFGSPNINAGNSTIPQDIDQQARPNGTAVDIGADEFYPDTHDFSFTPSYIDEYVDRNSTASYDHDLTNENSTQTDSYTFVCFNSLGWSVVCPISETVPVGQSAIVTTDIIVPGSATALQEAYTVITATSTLSPLLKHEVRVRSVVSPLPGIQFTPSYSLTNPPGEIITLTHTITNTGDAPDAVRVQIVGDTFGWAELIPTPSLTVPLGINASADIQVRITVPPNAAAIVPNITTIRATSQYDADVYTEVVDRVRAEETVGTRYVWPASAGGDDFNNNCTEHTLPCATVEHAIGQAVTNDAVQLSFGTGYTVSTAVQINETIHLSGNWRRDFAEQDTGQQTVIQPTGTTQIFILSGSSNNSTFESLTLQGGSAGPLRGGAVNVGNGVQANFTYITFRDNQAERGGALQVGIGGLAIVESSQFVTNTATLRGGAINVENGTLVLRQSAFNDNAATGSVVTSGGGAVYVANGLVIVENTLFNDNTAVTNGGALAVQSSNANVNFATIINNHANNGAGIYSDNGGGQPFQLNNSILADNTAVTSGGALHVQAGSINGEYVNFFNNNPANVGTIIIANPFNADPGFVPGDSEFHLLSTSAMVDARPRNVGIPANELDVDFEGDARPADEGFDLGYDELAGCSAKRDDTVFGSIQAALDMSNPQSDLILVSGICRGVNSIDVGGLTLQQTVHITGSEEITIQGGWTGDFEERLLEATTFIDPQGNGRAFYISGPVSVTLEYLTIQNGDANNMGGGPAGADAGGQIYNTQGQVTLKAVTMLTGTATHGAAYYQNSGVLNVDLLLATEETFELPQNSDDIPLLGLISEGHANNGGAFNIGGGAATINAAEILSNTADTNGAAIYHGGGILTATNSVIAFNNASGDGGGVFHTGAGAAQLLHLTFYQNNALSDGGAVYRQSGSGPLTIHSNIFQNNDAASGDAINAPASTAEDYNYYYGQTAPLAGGVTLGTNSTNQGTAGIPPGLLDPAAGNFHLSDDAPAADSGDPNSPVTTDFDDDTRPSNQGPDMGADEVAGCRVELNGVFYGSIQEALNHAQPGDLIRVSGRCSGVHPFDPVGGAGGCGGDGGAIATTVHITQNVILQGGWDDNFETRGEEVTVLDAGGLGRVIYVAPGVTATVEGFHIVNGALTGTNGNGAGICIDNASPTIRHNHIATHTATNGAAVYSLNSDALIDGNRIYNSNASLNGGGVYASGTAVLSLFNNFIYSNTAVTNGAGFYSASGNHLFWHNTVVYNTANNLGDGAYVNAGAPQFRSSIFQNNNTASTDGVHGNAGSAPTVNYSDFFGQQVNLGGTAVGAYNLTVDPLLTQGYTLTVASPMLDAGDPALTLDHDFEDHLRPSHLGFDIGADEIAGCVARNLAAPTVIYGSVQVAVDEALDNDTIQVDGVCINARPHPDSGTSVQNLFVDKPLTIDGDWQSDLVLNSNLTATLSALGNGRVLYVAASGALTLTNIHLFNGDAVGAGLGDHGGGIYNAGTLWLDDVTVRSSNAVNGGGVYNQGNLTARHSYIQANTAAQGGGVYNNGGTAVLTDKNRISNNSVTGNGGGVHQANGALSLDGNRIYENTAPVNNVGNGGGVYLAGGTANQVAVRNNFIYQNSAFRGGGLYNHNTNTPIWHNTFYVNSATNSTQAGGGIYTTQSVEIRSNIVHASQGSGIHLVGALNPAHINYNNVVDNLANNVPANYSGNASAGPNDISLSPTYVSAVIGDLHLRSFSAGVDNGDPAVPFAHDIDGDLRPTNGGPDRGADEINSCLIRVIDPLDPAPATREHLFGVLQDAIDFAEGFAPGLLPTVEIARGECSGVRLDSQTGTEQVGIVREDLEFEGSLRRLDFQYVGDYTSEDVGALSTVINAEGDGRVIYIANNADPTFTHIAFVNGNAASAGGGTNGGAILVPGNGSVQLFTTYVCESAATNGGGLYLSATSGQGRENFITGSTIGECWAAHVEEDTDGSVLYTVPLFFFGNSASGSGGGLYNSGDLDMTDVAMFINDAQNGGAIYNTATDLRIINGLFYSNTAVSNGGAIFNSGANLELYHNTFTENLAETGNGGGIHNESGATGFVLNSSIVESNLAPNGSGGGLSMPGGLNPTLAYNNAFNNSSTVGFGSNPVPGDPDLRGFYPIIPPMTSPVIDRADPALLDPGVPVPGGNYPIDFDARLVTRPDGGTQHLGTRASDVGAIEWWKDFGCTVTPPTQQQTVSPDNLVNYVFYVTNTGFPYPPSLYRHGFTDTIGITLTSSLGWGSLQGGDVQTFVNMGWNETRAVILTVSAPIDAQNGQFDTSIILCQSQSRPDRTNEGRANTFVGLVSGVIVYPAYTDSAQPGDVLTFTHTVENVGNDTHSFDIVPSAGIQHANAVLLENGMPVSQTVATLARNQTTDVVLEVTILDTALRGEEANPGVVAVQTDDPQNVGAVQNDILILGEPGTRYVAPDGQDTGNNCRVLDTPCGTIQHAIFAAEPGDDILVAQGTFADFSSQVISGTTFVQNVVISKSVNIYGGYSTLDDFTTQYPITQTTRLDGEGARRVIYVMPGITATVSGLFIENGNASLQSGEPDYGGGLYNAGANLTITATFFISNQARFGAGLYQTGGQLAVNSSVFSNNSDLGGIRPSSGGGVMVENGTAVLENNTFVNNRMTGDDFAQGNGGAVFAGDNAALTSRNNIFSQNSAVSPGSAVYVTATAVITSDYNLYWLNEVNFITGTNSLVAAPDFVDATFHIAATSSAKDTGTELTSRDWLVDYDIQPRIQGATIDMGADERVQQPGFTLTPITQTAVLTAGQPYTYRHLLQNIGDPSDSYSLSLLNQPVTPGGSWSVSMTPASNTGVLTSGQSITITLVITGDTAGSIARSVITATSDNYALTASAVDTSTVSFTPGVDIAPNRSGFTAPAVPIVYSHVLTNTGTGIDRFALSLDSGAPAGWTMSIVPTQTGFLDPNETLTFTVSVTPPPGTPPNEVHTVQVLAESLNTLGIPAADTLEDQTSVLEARGLLLLPMTQTQNVPDNSTAVYLHTLQNSGNITTTADLTISGLPNTWLVSVEPASVQLDPAETVSVTVTVNVPVGSGGLTHTALITATAQEEPAVTATAVDTTTVLVMAGVIIEPDNSIVTNPDITVIFTHTVTNIGNGTETFDLSYVNTLTWTTTIIPDFVTLAQNESTVIQVAVVVPPEAVPDSPNVTTVTAQSRSNPDEFDTAIDETRIRQDHSLIFIPDQTGTADPGTTIGYSHWLTNTGNGTDSFMVTAVTENGWTTITPPTAITLPPNAGTQVAVSLVVPIGAAGRTEIMTVTATSLISPTATAQAIDTTTVNGEPGELGVEIAPDRAASGNPGDTLFYLHTITNTGTIPEEFLLTVASVGGWPVGVSLDSITLSAGETASVQVTTTIPLTAGVGSSDVAVVTARSQTDATVSDTAQDTTTVIGTQGFGVVIAPDNMGTADAGDTITYTHWVTNTGNGTDTFNLTAVSSHGWLTTDPAPVTLAAGASAQIVATLFVPAAAITTTDVMTVTAVSVGDPTVMDSATDTTTVNGVSGTLGVLLEPDNTAVAAPGDTVQYQHWLTNTGTVTDDYQIIADSSQGWTIVSIPGPGTFIRLAPGQAASVVMRVTVPGTATDGMIDVTTVTAVSLSDNNVLDLARDTTTVNVEITPPTIYLPIILRPATIPVTPTPITPTPITPTPITPTPTGTPGTPTPSPTPCAPTTNIDLIVTQIEVVPGAPTSGQPAQVYVTIRNQGSQAVPFGNNFFLDFYVDRTPQPYLVGNVVWGIQGADMTAGTSRTYQAPYTFGGGPHQLWAQVDTDRHVNECPNENNNTFGPVTITVSGLVIEGAAVPSQYGPRQTPEPVLPTYTPLPFTPTPGMTPTPEATPTTAVPPPDVDAEPPLTATPTP